MSKSTGTKKSYVGYCPQFSIDKPNTSTSAARCEMCKARKVKCDRVEPMCGGCRLHNRECVYKERKKPGLQAQYGSDMESKVNKMEESLSRLARRVETISKGQESADQVATPREMYNDSIYDTDTRTSASPPITHSSTTRRRRSRPLRSAGLTAEPSLDLHTNTISTYSLPTSSPQLMKDFGGSELPPYHMLYGLTDLFFKHIITWAPILDRKMTFAMFSASASLDEDEIILFHAIVVTSLRFYDQPNLASELRTWYEKNSKRKVQIFALENTSIKALQALVLVTLSVIGTSHSLEGWKLLAHLARSIIRLELGFERTVHLERHPDTPSSSSSFCALARSKDWAEEEERRRLVWLVYMLDRYATLDTHLDFSLDEMAVNTQLPCRYDLFCQTTPVETRYYCSPGSMDVVYSRAEHLGSFSYHCEVLRILSNIHHFLQRPLEILSARSVRRWKDTYRDLDAELDSWLSRLPGDHESVSQLCHPDPAARVSNWIMIHAAFVVAVIRLHSVAAYPVVQSHVFMPSHNAMQRCLAAIRSLTAITQEATDAGILVLLGPPFAYALWTAGRLCLVHASTMESDSDPNIWYMIDTLERMGQYWEIARLYASTLREVTKRGHDSGADIYSGAFDSPTASFKAMRRSDRGAYQHATSTSNTRQIILEPTSSRLVSANELEELDVFGFFHYPTQVASNVSERVVENLDFSAVSPAVSEMGWRSRGIRNPVLNMDQREPQASFLVADPKMDWLDFQHPYDLNSHFW